MAMYDEFMCDCCGSTSFNERELDTGICRCGHGNVVKCQPCAICETLIPTHEFSTSDFDNICDECFDKGETVENALEYADVCSCPVDVPINEFVAEALGVERINQILADYVRQNIGDYSKEVCHYVEGDKICFAEFLENKANDSE